MRPYPTSDERLGVTHMIPCPTIPVGAFQTICPPWLPVPARPGVVRARTSAINELKASVLTSPDELRSELRGLTTTVLIKRCVAFRTATKRAVAEQCVRNTTCVVARRIQHFNDEIELHDIAMKELVDDTAPQLVAQPGVGYVTAARRIVTCPHS